MHALGFVRYACHETGGRMRAFAKADQRLGEVPVGVHRHVPGDIVKDVRFGKIVELVRRSNRYRRRESAVTRQSKKLPKPARSHSRLCTRIPDSGLRNLLTASSLGTQSGVRQRERSPPKNAVGVLVPGGEACVCTAAGHAQALWRIKPQGWWMKSSPRDWACWIERRLESWSGPLRRYRTLGQAG